MGCDDDPSRVFSLLLCDLNVLGKPITEIRMKLIVTALFVDAVKSREEILKFQEYLGVRSFREQSCHGGEIQRHVNDILRLCCS